MEVFYMENAILETKKLVDYAYCDELRYVGDVIESYGYSIPHKDFEFMKMITAIYHYGQVVGIRRERAKRKGVKA